MIRTLFPSATDQDNIMDVCGDNTEGQTVQGTFGYINSLNYPIPYSPDNTCRCTLTAPSLHAQIILSLLDLNLGATANDKSDWLEYSSSRQDWGTGRVLRLSSQNRTVRTGSQIIYLNFRSDHQREARGFWLQYQGIYLLPSTCIKVSYLCKAEIPTQFRSFIQRICLPPHPLSSPQGVQFPGTQLPTQGPSSLGLGFPHLGPSFLGQGHYLHGDCTEVLIVKICSEMKMRTLLNKSTIFIYKYYYYCL